MSTVFWIWMSAAVIFLIIELATPTLVFACFVAGALGAGIYSGFAPESYYWQLGIFVAVSVVLLPLTRKLADKITKPPPEVSNVDRMIGQVALVIKEIDPDLGGQVKYEGETWVARADERIEVNTKVKILSVTGTRVMVERLAHEPDERIVP
jgi:membrane protein implicated in regulation of membrane protease activity